MIDDTPPDRGAGTLKLGEPPDAPKLAVREMHVVVVEGPGAGTEVPCGARPVRIGAASDNDLVVNDPAVSRHHAIVEAVGGQVVVRDLGSTNGTFVAKVRVQSAFVDVGALITIGQSTLTLRVRAREGIPLSPKRAFGSLVGESARMRQLFTLLEWIAPTAATVLVTGPTGTGKELVARSLHDASPRASAPFVVLDCGAADPNLISSELFGHEAGAFTGAVARRAGVFESAKGGTVFLDELGELPLDLQPKLLRILESRELKRLGGSATIPLDFRLVAATNRRLEQMIATGTFREDLYYRVCQVKVSIPALDERREDVPLLARTLLERFKDGARAASPEAIAHLTGSSFPGNVRELKNVLERAALIARTDRVELEDLLMLAGGDGPVEPAPAVSRPPAPPPGSPEERAQLVAALEAHDFNMMQSARALGIALNTLKARMAKHGIPRRTQR
jgi:DNA-binding NtrC family response regulator